MGTTALGLAAMVLAGCSQPSEGGVSRAASHDPVAFPGTADKVATRETGQATTTARTEPLEVDPVSAAATQHSQGKSGQRIRRQFASASLDDNELGDVRGGFEAAPGVEFNFAFQQQTFVNSNLVQSVIVPTLTVAPSTGMISAASTPFDFATAAHSLPGATGTTTLNGVPVQTIAPRSLMASPNGGVVQSIPALPGVNTEGTTALSAGLGGSGFTNVITNTQNSQLVQQVTSIGIGVSGLQQLLNQTSTMSVLNRLNAGSAGLR